MTEKANPFDPSYFFFKLPIYSRVLITEENQKEATALLKLGLGGFGEEKNFFDGYNPFRKQVSTFQGWGNGIGNSDHFWTYGGVGEITIKCKRYEDVFYYYVRYDKKKATIEKIGQYPSIADFHIFELGKYNKILSKPKLKEFSKAIGLAANGVGIGSFVYLRRLFEHLVFSTFASNKEVLGIGEKEFVAKRMEDKIATLAQFLPEFLVQNKVVYSILSLGVHELEEDACLSHFDALRIGIEIMLDEQLERVEKLEKTKLAQQKIQAIQAAIKKQ